MGDPRDHQLLGGHLGEQCVDPAINPGTTARTKHFESWLRYVRELYLNLVITVNWVPTKEQIADLFTKPLDKTTFLYLRSLLMTEQR